MDKPVDQTPIDADEARQLLRQYLESLQAAGVEQLPHGRRGSETPSFLSQPATPQISASPTAPSQESLDATVPPSSPAKQRASTEPPSPIAAAATSGGEPGNIAIASSLFEPGEASEAKTLEALEAEVAGCTLCKELAETRAQTVFGAGNPNARLCFLGEAPGADEDRQGEPFVGRSGQLLTKILAACNLTRDDVYILNILKCRPPGNRDPLPQESSACRRYLNRQLQLIGPEFICCLGGVAAQNLLETATPIGRLRGKVHDYQGIRVVCTYHPAYLLRNPRAKKDAWEDMKLLMREMGTPVG